MKIDLAFGKMKPSQVIHRLANAIFSKVATETKFLSVTTWVVQTLVIFVSPTMEAAKQ